jgi:hypothetical protein
MLILWVIFTYIAIRSSELVGSGRWKWLSNEQKKVEKGEREKKGGKEGREEKEKRGREGREKKKERERGRREAIDSGSGIYSEAELIVEGAGRKGGSRKKGRGKGRKSLPGG